MERMVRVYAIASGKGGVGKTTVAANLGVSLGRLRKKTLVIDADLAMDGIAGFFGIGETTTALHDLLVGRGSIEGAMQSVYGIKVIPSGETLRGFLKADPEKLKRVVDRAKRDLDYIIIDLPPGLNKYSLAPLKVADEVLLVVTPELPSIEAVKKLQSVLEVLGKKTGGVIVNRLRKPSFFDRLRGVKFMETGNIERKLNAKILGEIPEDLAVIESINARKPVIIHRPKSPASKAFDKLARVISGPVEEEKLEEKKPPWKEKPREKKPKKEKPGRPGGKPLGKKPEKGKVSRRKRRISKAVKKISKPRAERPSRPTKKKR